MAPLSSAEGGQASLTSASRKGASESPPAAASRVGDAPPPDPAGVYPDRLSFILPADNPAGREKMRGEPGFDDRPDATALRDAPA